MHSPVEFRLGIVQVSVDERNDYGDGSQEFLWTCLRILVIVVHLFSAHDQQHDHYAVLKIQGSRREDLCYASPGGVGLASKVAPAGPPRMSPDAVHQEPRYEPKRGFIYEPSAGFI